MKFTIISDSSCDLMPSDYRSDKFDFITAPMFINIDGKEFTDDENLDLAEMIKAMKASKNAVKTSCPSPEFFLEAMKNSDYVICITISSKVSGCYNSAMVAAQMELKENPEKKIFVLDSLVASAALALILQRLMEMIESEDFENFEDLCRKITAYRGMPHVRFILQDFSNLIKTGRMGKIAAIIASLLVIRPVCGDDGEGEIKICHKVLGGKKALRLLTQYAGEKAKTQKNLPVIVSHCFNETDALLLKELLENDYGIKNIKVMPMRGIISVYANDQGVLIGC